MCMSAWVDVLIREIQSIGYLVESEGTCLLVKLHTAQEHPLQLVLQGHNMCNIDSSDYSAQQIVSIDHNISTISGRAKLVKEINWLMPSDLLILLDGFQEPRDYSVKLVFTGYATKLGIHYVDKLLPFIFVRWELDQKLESGILRIKCKKSKDSPWIEENPLISNDPSTFSVFLDTLTKAPTIQRIIDRIKFLLQAPDSHSQPANRNKGPTDDERAYMLRHSNDSQFNPTTFQCIQALHARVCDLEEVKKGNT